MPLFSAIPASMPNQPPPVSPRLAMSNTTSAALKAHLQDIVPSSHLLRCHPANTDVKSGGLARFLHAIWPWSHNGAREDESAAMRAIGQQLMNDADALNAARASSSPAPPPFAITHKKYAGWGGLLMFGLLAEAEQGQGARQETRSLTTESGAPNTMAAAMTPYPYDVGSASQARHVRAAAGYNEPQDDGGVLHDELAFPQRTSLSRQPRALNFPRQVERDLSDALVLADLPEEDVGPVIRAVLEAFNQSPIRRKNKIRSETERLITLDIIVLTLGYTPGPYQTSFQKLGEQIRHLLGQIENSASAKQYLQESPPHSPVKMTVEDPEVLLDEYFDIASDNVIQKSTFFQDNSNSLDELIIETCQKRFDREVNLFTIPPLNQIHDVEFVKKYLIFIFRPYFTHQFTTRELFLGVHKRHAVQESMVDIIFPPGTSQFITSVLDAQPDITDYIEQELLTLYDKLSSNTEFESLFKQSLNYRVKGIVLEHIDVFKDAGIPRSISRFLQGDAIPHLVTLHRNVIPNIVMFTDPIDRTFVLVSLMYSEIKVFRKNIYYESLKEFVFKHLSLFDQQRITAGALNINIMCDAGIARNNIYSAYCAEPNLGHAHYLDYPKVLYDAMLSSIKLNINSITYTNFEYKRDDEIAIIQSLVFKMECLVAIASLMFISPLGTALFATIGLGSGIANFMLSKKNMQNTDNGIVYESALSEAKLGAWFTAFGAALDLSGGAKVLTNSFKAYKAKRLLGLGKASLTSPHMSEELKDLLKPKMYESQMQVSRLSSPDARGLQWGENNDSYLKVNGHYVKVVRSEDHEIYYVGKNAIATRFTSDGEFIPLKSIEKKNLAKGGMLSKDYGHFYKNSRKFKKINIPDTEGVGEVGYRSLARNHYIQFYSRTPAETQVGSETLVISAHGGYFSADLLEPSVALPPDVVIKFLAPHGMALEDPGLHKIVNAKTPFVSYLSIYDNHFNVQYIPQTHSQWRLPSHYDPELLPNVLGRWDGLQNYRHSHFAQEHPQYIARTIADNRKLAEMGEATLSDVLVVNNKISYVTDTDPAKASVQRVLDLDSAGELVNANGERYNTFVFAHCRNNLHLPESHISLYRTYFPSPVALPPGAVRARVILTIYRRANPHMPFDRQQRDIGDMALVPASDSLT